MNRFNYFSTASASTILLLFTGCTTVRDTLYLQAAEVTGPIVPTPVHLTDSEDTLSITISPWLNYITTNNLHGDIKQSFYRLDTLYEPPDHSLVWNVATINTGIDVDIALSKVVALSFGVNYSSQNNFNELGGNVGIGFNTNVPEIALRFDAGLQLHSMHYDAYTIVYRTVEEFWGNTKSYTFFFHDVGESTHFDPYFSLTFNTAYKSWPVNVFFNAGYVIQTLFSFEPRTIREYYGSTNTEYIKTDKRGSSTAGFINLTPGVYFCLDESSRILLGSRFYIESSISNSDPNFLVIPMIQVDFRL